MAGRSLRRRRGFSAVAAALLLGLPLAGFFLAPPARAQSGGSAGANLAGYNTSATAQPILVQLLTPGLFGAGDVALGNLVQLSIPYANSTVSSGPSANTLVAPAYPGPTAANIGGALVTGTNGEVPEAFAKLLNDPILAQSSYPAGFLPGIGTSGSYAPGTSALGIATASTQSSAAGTTGTSALTDTNLSGVVEIASTKADTSATLEASSVVTQSESTVSGISILGGAIQIKAIHSVASASSNGTGHPSSELEVSGVTVAGTAAYIGPHGIQLANTGGLLGNVLQAANLALTALQQLGISVTTIAPSSSVQGNSASVISGAVQIQFLDTSVPNPFISLGLSVGLPRTVGFDIDLGLSQVGAAASLLPQITPVTTTSPTTSTSHATTPITTTNTLSGGQTEAVTTTGTGATNTPSGPTGNTPASTPSIAPTVPAAVQPASFLGLPVKVGWTVLAFVLAVIASGPLLAYANWQLLRGRSK